MTSLLGMFLQLFRLVDQETINGLMPAAGEVMLVNRLLILPGVDRAMLIIGVNLCFFVLRPRGSMVLQRSRIMKAPGIL